LDEVNSQIPVWNNNSLSGSTNFNYQFPSQQQCAICHLPNGREILGFIPQQVFGSNDFQTMVSAGIVEAPTGEEPLIWSDWNTTNNLNHEVRSYLASNCAQCHSPEGRAAGATFKTFNFNYFDSSTVQDYINYETKVEGWDTAYIVHGTRPETSTIIQRMESRTTGIQMPPLGTNYTDDIAIGKIKEWINTLPEPSEVVEPLNCEIQDNILNNCSFTNGEIGWELFVNNTASATLSTTEKHAEINITDEGTADWHIQLLYGQLPLLANTEYTIQFRAKSSDLDKFEVKVVQNAGDYNDLSDSFEVTLSENWTNYEFKFTNSTADNNTKLQFSLGTWATGDASIDDIGLIQGETSGAYSSSSNTQGSSSSISGSTWPSTLGYTQIVSTAQGINGQTSMAQLKGSNNYLVTSKHSGQLHLLEFNSDFSTVTKSNFHNVGNVLTGNEQGLLGVTVHPDYATNKKYYLAYQPDTTVKIMRIEERQVSASKY